MSENSNSPRWSPRGYDGGMRIHRPTLASTSLAACVALALVLVPLQGARHAAEAREPGLRDARTNMAEPTRHRQLRRRSVDRACKFLAGRQAQDGSWGPNRAKIAITSLVLLALMADGSTDGRGPYGAEVRRGITFLVKLIEEKQPDDPNPRGYFAHPDDYTSRMHGQGFATFALASALGTSTGKRAARIRGAVIHAVRCIENSQNATGGFGYEPKRNSDHEGSVTVAVAQGLRAARDAGVIVDENVVRKGLKYLRSSQKKDGSFRYSLLREESTYALTGAALSSFFLYGAYAKTYRATIKRGLKYMTSELQRRGASQDWYYYGHFYTGWALWQWDGNNWRRGRGHLWANWQHTVLTDILSQQRESDGSFDKRDRRHDFGPELSTAFAALTLSIPDEGLPIFQR